MSNILRICLKQELEELKQGLEKVNELIQPSEEEDRTVLTRKYKEYINKGRILIKLLRNNLDQAEIIFEK